MDEDGRTPAHLTACWRKADCLKILIEAGADVKPAHLAAYWRKADCLKILIDAGVDLNIQNKYGDTALDLVKAGGRGKCIELLEAQGQPKIKDTKLTPIQTELDRVLQKAFAEGFEQAQKQMIDEIKQYLKNLTMRYKNERCK
jgi:ankyrin repeat protein